MTNLSWYQVLEQKLVCSSAARAIYLQQEKLMQEFFILILMLYSLLIGWNGQLQTREPDLWRIWAIMPCYLHACVLKMVSLMVISSQKNHNT